jgi:hypothetical protein
LDAWAITNDLAASTWFMAATAIDARICEVLVMPRHIVTNAELTKMINDRFRDGKELDGDCREVEVGGVQLYAAPDATGCNWDVSIYNGPAACQGVFSTVIKGFRRQYNLADD